MTLILALIVAASPADVGVALENLSGLGDVGAEWADELLDAGDVDGRGVWIRIMKAVAELRQREPGDRAVHCRLLLACHQFLHLADPRLNTGALR